MKKALVFLLAVAILATSAACGQKADMPDESGKGIWGMNIETTDLSGTSVTQQDFTENTLTILNVWATWCPPCVAELPELQEVSDSYADKGVQVVGVLQDGVTELGEPSEKTIKNALTLLEGAGAGYLVILPDETLTKELISTMQYFPTTFFIDKNGDVVHTVIGANSFDDWSAEIDDVLEQLS